MAKVRDIQQFGIKTLGSPYVSKYAIMCPACKCGHCIDERWTFNGDYDKPTFRASLLVNIDDPEKRCHSFITDGKIQFLDDCGHSLKGQTVQLEDI